MNVHLVGCALGAALGLAACAGPDCKATCDAAASCENATADTVAGCKSLCDRMEKCANATGCNDSLDDAVACSDDSAAKRCDPTLCEHEYQSFGVCWAAYVLLHPGHSSACSLQ